MGLSFPGAALSLRGQSLGQQRAAGTHGGQRLLIEGEDGKPGARVLREDSPPGAPVTRADGLLATPLDMRQPRDSGADRELGSNPRAAL